MSDYINRTKHLGQPALEVAKRQTPFWRVPPCRGMGFLQVRRDGAKGISIHVEETALGAPGSRSVSKEGHISLNEGEAAYLAAYLIENIDPKLIKEVLNPEALAQLAK